MWHAVPIKDLLLLLCSYAVVLVQEIEECALRFFEGGISTAFQVSQIGKDALLELFRVLDWSPKRLKSERKASDDISSGDVKEVVPATLLILQTPSSTDASTYHNTQETYSPVGKRNRRMYWSGVQSTGADIKKYFTDCC